MIKTRRQPAGPVSPRPALNLALGLLLGLALGAAIAMIREQLDTRVKTGRDLQRITGRTPLGLIGYIPKSSRKKVIRHFLALGENTGLFPTVSGRIVVKNSQKLT